MRCWLPKNPANNSGKTGKDQQKTQGRHEVCGVKGHPAAEFQIIQEAIGQTRCHVAARGAGEWLHDILDPNDIGNDDPNKPERRGPQACERSVNKQRVDPL